MRAAIELARLDKDIHGNMKRVIPFSKDGYVRFYQKLKHTTRMSAKQDDYIDS